MGSTSIEALGKLNAKESLPSLRSLLDDNERSHFGQLVSVADAARAAITKLERP
jgi:HEAT repeat protein